jgi:hypothetical protein
MGYSGELEPADRVLLIAKTASLPSRWEDTRCCRGQWVDFDLNGGGELDAIGREMREPRTACRFFFPYAPGYTPKQHLDLHEKHRDKRLQVKIAIWAFVGALVGSLIEHFTDLVSFVIKLWP